MENLYASGKRYTVKGQEETVTSYSNGNQHVAKSGGHVEAEDFSFPDS